MAAVIVGAIDQEAANASGTHFSECDFLAGSFGHAPIEARCEDASNRPKCWGLAVT
jgi:hypothetical protein